MNDRSGHDGTTTSAPAFDHRALTSLLGAWALTACSHEEAAAVEDHLTDCASCADEALRLRDAVGLLRPEETLDLDPLLRTRVLAGCLGRRPARIPIPKWAGPYDAETARLDALLRDLGDGYWDVPVELSWHGGRRTVRVAQVIGHLAAVDGLLTTALGLTGRLLPGPGVPPDPLARTEALWRDFGDTPASELHARWREQGNSLVRTVSFADRGTGGIEVPYGTDTLPLRDAFLDRAFECWIHAEDIATAVDYPYGAPAAPDLGLLIDRGARMLPEAVSGLHRAGRALSRSRPVPVGAAGRSLHLEVEGDGGGHWYIPLDSPSATASPDDTIAYVVLDALEFCRLAAGRVEPERIAVGQDGDRDAVRDILFATASLSHL